MILSTFDLVNPADKTYMQRALYLAQLGKGNVAPNPMVGAVIVHNDQIIGEGFHAEYGKAHAEVNAINSVSNKSLLSQSTIYVTLEPCSHFGKTPPCADLIIKHKIPRVVICNQDPFEKVDGNGIDKLKTQGINVITGVLESEGKKLNKRFFTFHKRSKPYIILKWAQTQDGFISRFLYDAQINDNWITNSISKQLVHQWRSEESAILVGKNTVLVDDPELTCREIEGKNPIRMIIDTNCTLKSSFKIFNKKANTIIFNSLKSKIQENIEWVKIDLSTDFMTLFNQFCFERRIQSVIIEGGSFSLEQFISFKNWDEARVFKGNKNFKKGIKAPIFDFEVQERINILKDTLSTHYNSIK